ncbi:dynamin family protein [Geodermatophilus ruber]|uniref:Dynamin family protein n=1 Tax=Geodermatophilus ruber TaxID=504800 RepID=A0A1I4BKG7_9ACTN|nr:dynamin family protein [Geodermatophilus ruber]SFK68850.1 Dynamin family protein [Geodermatophilus ruber]
MPNAQDAETARVLALVDEAVHEAQGRRRDDLATRLVAERRRVLRGSCAVLVVGEFNKGKSSLVNALLNARVCATDADVATAVPTVVRFGEQLTVASGGADDAARSPVDPADTEALQTRDDRSAPAGAEVVEVAVPRELLRDGLVLVDTPGMGGGLASAHAARALRALAGADAVVFVTDASQELTAPEVELLRRVAGLCRRVLCVLTKLDLYPEWRRIRDLDEAHLRTAGLRLPVQPLSSALRHHGLRTGDRRAVTDSGYPRLAAFLRGTVAATGRQGLAAAAAAAHSALSQLVAELATARAALTDPARQREQLEALRDAQHRAEELRGGGSRWLQLLNDRIGDLTSTVDFDLAMRIRAVRKEAFDRLETADPRREWVELEPWLHERVNAALADHLRLLRDQADEVADEVAGRFGEDAWRLRAHADIVRVTDQREAAPDEIGLAALAASRASRVELGIAAVRGGSTGAVLSHAVGLLVVAVASVPLAPVVFPTAALLGGLFARTTYRAARTAQLRALRAEAERTISLHLDEVEMRARRDTRDSLRRIHQHLRDVFAGHATELQASVHRNLETLAHTVREDQQGRQERLQRADAELTRLRALAGRAEALLGELLGTGPEAAR